MLVLSLVVWLSVRRSAGFVVTPGGQRRSGVVVKELPADLQPVNPELDGTRKAFALFNQGLIDRDEIAEYAEKLSFKERERLKAEAAAEAAKAAEDARLASLAKGSLDVAAGAGAFAGKVAEFAGRVAADAAGRAGKAALNAASASASNVASKAAESAKTAAASAVDSVVDAAVKAPARSAKEAVVDFVFKAPARKAQEAATAPLKSVEADLDKKRGQVLDKIDQVKEFIENVPSEARKNTKVAQLVAQGAAQLAADTVKEKKAAATNKLRTNEDKSSAPPPPPPPPPTAELAVRGQKEEVAKDALVTTEEIGNKLKTFALSAASAASEAALKAAKEAQESTMAAAREAAEEAVTERKARLSATAALESQKVENTRRLRETSMAVVTETAEVYEAMVATMGDPSAVETDLQDRTVEAKQERDTRLPPVQPESPVSPRSVPPSAIKRPPMEKKAEDIVKEREASSAPEESPKERRRRQANLAKALIEKTVQD